ncbi:MAG: HAMP domain-containing protein, partial [Actinocatenispora sp.]
MTFADPLGQPPAGGRTRRRGGFLRPLVGRMPLATRMVATALALVLLGLVLISAASVMFLRTYLTNRVDAQLHTMGDQINQQIDEKVREPHQDNKIPVNLDEVVPTNRDSAVQVPSAYVFEVRHGDGDLAARSPGETTDSGKQNTVHVWPSYPHSASQLDRHAGEAFTASSNVGEGHWRVLVHRITIGSTTQYVVISGSTRDLNDTLSQLIRIEVGVGIAVLVALALMGAAVVSYSLRPLRDIERTAGTIANGNLGLRVPERDPRTELGRLGRALNAMLGQIEAAFAAQAGSEYAARRSADAARRA